MQQLRVICYTGPSHTVFFKVEAVSNKYFTESEKTLQIKTGQNSVSVNQCFSLYFFFSNLCFFCVEIGIQAGFF